MVENPEDDGVDSRETMTWHGQLTKILLQIVTHVEMQQAKRNRQHIHKQ